MYDNVVGDDVHQVNWNAHIFHTHDKNVIIQTRVKSSLVNQRVENEGCKRPPPMYWYVQYVERYLPSK